MSDVAQTLISMVESVDSGNIELALAIIEDDCRKERDAVYMTAIVQHFKYQKAANIPKYKRKLSLHIHNPFDKIRMAVASWSAQFGSG